MLYILCLAVLLLLLFVSGVKITRTKISRYELHRLAETGDSLSKDIVRREEVLHDVLSLQRATSALLLVIVTLLSIAAAGWLMGSIVAIVVALEFGFVARLPVIQRFAQRRYESHEKSILGFVAKHPRVFSVLRSVTHEQLADHSFGSREELLYAIEKSESILTRSEKLLLEYGLQFNEFSVEDIMVPVAEIVTVGKNELLGPLVLDDLHKTGHTRFPVIHQDIQHVVGVLSINDMLTVDSGKRSTTAEKSMDARVFYIHEQQPLEQALSTFLQVHHSMLIVVNADQQVVGLLSLEDVIEALFGRRIVDGFEGHDDLQNVAQRHTR